MIRSVRILYSLAVLLAAFVLSGCAKSAYEQTEKLVTLQISLDAKGITKAESSDAEKSIGSVRIYAYRKDTGSQVGHYYRGQASAEPIYMDLALPERGQHDVEFLIIANETSVRFHSDFAFTEGVVVCRQMGFVDRNGFQIVNLHVRMNNERKSVQVPDR